MKIAQNCHFLGYSILSKNCHGLIKVAQLAKNRPIWSPRCWSWKQKHFTPTLNRKHPQAAHPWTFLANETPRLDAPSNPKFAWKGLLTLGNTHINIFSFLWHLIFDNYSSHICLCKNKINSMKFYPNNWLVNFKGISSVVLQAKYLGGAFAYLFWFFFQCRSLPLSFDKLTFE